MTINNYCMVCGSVMAEGQVPTETRPRLFCPTCGYIHYINPKVVCGTLPLQDGRVWLLRRGIEPRLGYWTYPAGFQEIDESSDEAAVRETLEELGCTVEITGLFGVYSRPDAPVNIVYVARLTENSPAPSPTDEALEVQAFAPDEVPWDDLAFLSTQAVLRDWVATPTPLAHR
ncbi:MAG: NUDIX domain-containing protein [Chloroflexia bacterium]